MGFIILLTLFKMGLFGAAHGWGWGGGGKKAPPPPPPPPPPPQKGSPPPLQNMSHISCIDETWHSYTLPKEDPKIRKSRDTLLEFY